MASLNDLGPVVREIGWWTLAKRVYRETLEDHVFVYASALSYAWLFALFPTLIFFVSMLPFLPESARAGGKRRLIESIETAFPGPAADQILSNPKLKTVLDSVLDQRHGAVVSISLIIAIYAASNGLSMIMTALDQCYDIDKGRPFYKAKPVSVLLTVVIVVMVLIVLTVIPLGTAVRHWIIHHSGTIPFTDIALKWWMVRLFDFARYFVGLTFAFAILSLIYNFGTSVRMRWRLLSPGAVFCFIAWIVLGAAFRIYLTVTGGTSYAQTFGPAAGLAILMLLFFLYGVVLLIGAELNAEIDKVRLKVEPGTRDLRPAQKALAAQLREAKTNARRQKLTAIMPPP